MGDEVQRNGRGDFLLFKATSKGDQPAVIQRASLAPMVAGTLGLLRHSPFSVCLATFPQTFCSRKSKPPLPPPSPNKATLP